MACAVYLPPAGDADCQTMALAPLSAFTCCSVERAGRWYGLRSRRQRDVSMSSAHNSCSVDDGEEGVDSTDGATATAGDTTSGLLKIQSDFDLMSLDPKDKKEQDHYAVLGLAHLRYRASDDDVKKAYRNMVLKHHPDKRKDTGGYGRERLDAVFTCIKHANDVLSNPSSRRSYDSVDPNFDDAIPSNSANSKANFISVFGPVFERNSRWSRDQPMPLLGDDDTSYEDVDDFYGAWYEFDSWREFSYLDKEDVDKAESREERRWLERQNKQQRTQKKKEESTRLRTLVDNAYACDPRIRRFKEEAKRKKEDQKAAKAAAAKAAADERLRVQREKEEAERKQQEAEAEEARLQAEAARKTREANKKAMQRERKAFRTACKSHNYFTDDDAKRVSHMENVELLCEALSITQLERLRTEVSAANYADAKGAFDRQVSQLQSQQEREVRQAAEAAAAKRRAEAAASGKSASQNSWGNDDAALLVKAVKMHPAGTVNRWEVISQFVNQHSTSGATRTSKECISMAKNIQKDATMKKDVNKKAFERFDKQHGQAASRESVPTERTEGPSGMSPWTADEQKLLEKAMKAFPSSDPERWEKISAKVGTRSVVEVKKRVKELVDKVKAKKSAAAASK
ncbi:dnaJ homolog subfamily C member 2-like [Sycon ciliatum]|uniref:dnaJ homolog subfamily C member 2-like n=1 Tax=Sycon ciliatum TaxID=27933 RepID=UPI0020A8F8A5|eukprot:scpid51118/ scgid35032/ DnaJ homolog subfamily C member 2; Gliosarcoma-related antigen MIDA1; Zuotin-related factor 1